MWLFGRRVQKSFVNCFNAVHARISHLSIIAFPSLVKHSKTPDEFTHLLKVLRGCL